MDFDAARFQNLTWLPVIRFRYRNLGTLSRALRLYYRASVSNNLLKHPLLSQQMCLSSSKPPTVELLRQAAHNCSRDRRQYALSLTGITYS